MENKIEKLNKKLKQSKDEGTTKDKVIIRLKNKNTELMMKIVKTKGEHDQALQVAKIESDKLKKEIEKLKAQVNIEDDKNIFVLEAKVATTKKAYDNVNNDNVALHKIIKDFQKYLIEQMEKRLKAMNECFMLK